MLGADPAVWATIAALLGGSLAATRHFTKAGSRALINSSPEPISNVVASTAEGVLVAGLLALVIAYTLAAAAIVALLVLLPIWLLPKLARFIVRMLRRLSGNGTSGTAREALKRQGRRRLIVGVFRRAWERAVGRPTIRGRNIFVAVQATSKNLTTRPENLSCVNRPRFQLTENT